MHYSKEMYAQKLDGFFERHDPLKREIVNDIVEQFPKEQEQVFDHLTKRYAKKAGVENKIVSNATILSEPPAQNKGIG